MPRQCKGGHAASCGLALLTLLGLTLLGLNAAPCANAQTLTLGQSGIPSLSGTAILTSTGASATGVYTYQDGGTGAALASQHNFKYLYAYGASTANFSGASVQFDTVSFGLLLALGVGGLVIAARRKKSTSVR